MSYNFKKIMDLDLVNEVPEGANVLIETEGATKRLPSTAINNGYSKDEVYNKTEADNKFLTKETIAKPDWNQNDETAPDYVKNRTHYEETTVVNEPLNITWDGNTEGLVSVGDGPMGWYKVSDLVFTDEEIKLMTITTDAEDMGSLLIGDAWDEMLGTQIQVFDDLTVAIFAAFVRTDGAMLSEQESSITFPEKGIYFVKIDEGFAVSSLTTTEPVEHTKTVVKKLDRKYLPDDAEKKMDKVDVIWEDQYSNKTFDEIVRELNGRGVEALNITIRFEDTSSGKVMISYPIEIALYETKITATFFGYTISSLSISHYTLSSTGTYVQKSSKSVTIS